MGYPPTAEQQNAIDQFTADNDLVIQAGAGAGKTSTLRLLAAAKPRARGLYIAYNRAIKDDAKRAFPPQVTCVTSHGQAFRDVGVHYKHRLGGARQTGRDAARIIDITTPVKAGPVVLGPWQQARLVMAALKKFCYSADPKITAGHVPYVKGLARGDQRALSEYLAPFAEAAWKDIVNPHGKLRFEHDHYLKIWALTGPRLDYDYVLLDEAQDANPLLTGMILNQTHTQRIAVGDSAQQIYAFRGAQDALNRLPGVQCTLSQSFRFGPAIADAANRWLELLDGPLRLTGSDQIASRTGPVTRPDAVLCRTNAGAMSVAMACMAAGSRVALVGDTSRQIQSFAAAAIELMASGTTSHPELLAFMSWDQVREYAESEDGGSDLRPLVRLVDEHGPHELLAAAKALHDESRAQVTVSTAHKSKGREWSTVVVHGDFQEPRPDKDTGEVLVRPEEARLAYVAVTRAREALDCSSLSWVSQVGGLKQ